MESYSLVVSDPPHAEVDFQSASELLGITPAELRMKSNFPAPEVWLALDEKGASDAVESLRSAGVNALIIAGRDLESIPWSAQVESFTFAEERFVARFKDGEVELPYDVQIDGVFGSPPADLGGNGTTSSALTDPTRTTWGRRSTGTLLERTAGSDQGGEAPGHVTSFDLYASHEGTLCRLSITDHATDFAGLEDMKLPRARDNIVTCVLECGRRFPAFALDTRLINVRSRKRLTVGSVAQTHEGRKLFAFGTLGLRKLLGDIAPELEDITQFELGSRIAHLMHRQGSQAVRVERSSQETSVAD